MKGLTSMGHVIVGSLYLQSLPHPSLGAAVHLGKGCLHFLAYNESLQCTKNGKAVCTQHL